jgi:hypothetical protein
MFNSRFGHLHREQALPELPSTIAGCHAVVVVLLDARDTTALRRVLAGRSEVRMIRITRHADDARARADVECLAGASAGLIERLGEAARRGELGPITTFVRRSGVA